MPGQGDGLLPDELVRPKTETESNESKIKTTHHDSEPPVPGSDPDGSGLDHPGPTDDGLGERESDRERVVGEVGSQPELAQSVPTADQSAEPKKQTDSADKSVLPADKSVKKVLDFTGFKSRRLTSQSVADFDKKLWKRSRIKSGWLIRRMTGYSIVENEYGVQYLGVVSRKPDKMSADSVKYPLAGFFTWTAMIKRTLLVEERGQQDVRTKLG